MKLLTKEIVKRFTSHPFGSQEDRGFEAEVLVKYFAPSGAGTWLVTEAEQLDCGDWHLWGYCHIHEWEWGTLLLSELESLRLPFGLRVERDLYSSTQSVREHLRCHGIRV